MLIKILKMILNPFGTILKIVLWIIAIVGITCYVMSFVFTKHEIESFIQRHAMQFFAEKMDEGIEKVRQEQGRT